MNVATVLLLLLLIFAIVIGVVLIIIGSVIFKNNSDIKKLKYDAKSQLSSSGTIYTETATGTTAVTMIIIGTILVGISLIIIGGILIYRNKSTIVYNGGGRDVLYNADANVEDQPEQLIQWGKYKSKSLREQIDEDYNNVTKVIEEGLTRVGSKYARQFPSEDVEGMIEYVIHHDQSLKTFNEIFAAWTGFSQVQKGFYSNTPFPKTVNGKQCIDVCNNEGFCKTEDGDDKCSSSSSSRSSSSSNS